VFVLVDIAGLVVGGAKHVGEDVGDALIAFTNGSYVSVVPVREGVVEDSGVVHAGVSRDAATTSFPEEVIFLRISKQG
jgi:hypothetical protein